jgi:hypothetical protein
MIAAMNFPKSTRYGMRAEGSMAGTCAIPDCERPLMTADLAG